MDRSPQMPWHARQQNVMAQRVTGTLSKDHSQYTSAHPTHTNGQAHRCYIFGSDGRRYIDFISALGALSLGYCNERVTEAAIRQTRKGVSFSLPTTLEVEVAEALADIIPACEKIRFFKNGKDAADAAIRIARAYSNKSTILSLGYHGCSDIFTSLTPPAAGVKDVFHVKQLTDDADFTDVAAVIIEAIQLDDGINYQAWIKALREKCIKSNTIFIIDEIITGFRHPKWCVSNAWGLNPDIILLGKGMANGFPLSAIGGKKEIMDTKDWFFSTTFSGEAVSLAACQATIDELSQRSFEDLMFYGKRLQAKLNALNAEITFQGYGTRCMLNTTNETTALFMQECAKAGILFGKAHFFHFAHLDENVEQMVMNTAEAVIENMKQGRVKLEGQMPKEAFKRN